MSFQPFDLNVEELDAAHDGGSLRACVVVLLARVVDDRELHVGGVHGRAAADGLVRPPLGVAGRSPAPPSLLGAERARSSRGSRRGARERLLTSRCSRVSIPWRAPVHQGFPRRPPALRCSCDPVSGPSSDSGAASRQALQRPAKDPARSEPIWFLLPRHETPASVNRRVFGVDVAARVLTRSGAWTLVSVTGARAKRARHGQRGGDESEDEGEGSVHGVSGWLLNRSRARAANLR